MPTCPPVKPKMIARSVPQDDQLREPLQRMLQLWHARIVLQAEVPAHLVGPVEGHRQPHLLRVVEQVLHHLIHHRHVRHHLADAPAPQVLIVPQQVAQRRSRRVRHRARVYVAERDQPVRVLLAHLQDVLIRLRQVNLRADDGQQDPLLDPHLIIPRQNLLRGMERTNRRRLPIGVAVDINEHDIPLHMRRRIAHLPFPCPATVDLREAPRSL
jgi:hypothetical protein